MASPILLGGSGASVGVFDDLTDVSFTAADKAIPVWDAGQGLLIAGAYAPSFVRKLTDTVRNNTAALTDDPALTVALTTNTTYHLRGSVLYAGTTTGDFKIAWTYPAAATVNLPTTALAVATTGTTGSGYFLVYDLASGTAYGTGIGANTSKCHMTVEGTIVVGANAGNLTFQWSQQTAEVSDLTVYAGSFLALTKVS